MQKRLVGPSAVLALGSLSLILWIYWVSNIKPSNGIAMLKPRNNRFIRDLIIEPHNTTCQRNNEVYVMYNHKRNLIPMNFTAISLKLFMPFLDKHFVIIIITSYVGNIEFRSAHRRSMPQDLLDSMNIIRIFLLAKIPPHEKYITQNAIEDEANTFGDILQGSFIESYRNLTLKNLMGLQWASNKCTRTSFIVKVDDDTMFNIESTYKLLSNMSLDENLLMGHVVLNMKPERRKQNKWFVSLEEYSRYSYPPYLSGWYYVTTPKVAAEITNEAIHHPLFWIDDVFITGLLPETLNMKLVPLPKKFWLESLKWLNVVL